MKRLYYYSTGDQTLTASTSLSKTIKIDSDANFEIMKIMAKSTSTFSLKVTFSDPSYILSQNRIPNVAICGSYTTEMNRLVFPMLIRANSVIECDILDTSGSGNVVDIVFEGYKVFGM